MSHELRTPETIFAQAIEIAAPEDRAAFLDGACGEDAQLRGEVEKLVGDHFRAGGFLERPAVELVATMEEPLTERPGTLIGPYKLMEQIGEGGMGLVFVAEQQRPVRRKVALKVLKPGMDTRQVIARFEAERQALALMDHPNIARVLDVGATPSGRPYFVMELVKGVPITEFCDDHRLTPRERLELFVSVCQAVQHAHQKGIIHRDVKPSNVMVTSHDGTPVVKVIDFGVAKAIGQQLTEKTLYTAFTQMIGTPQYMSPEQAGMSSLDVDTRSDIYALGVLLYELLTGTTPFNAQRLRTATYDEVRRIIREEEPPRPSTRIGTPERATTATGSGARSARHANDTALLETRYDLARIAAQRQSDPARLRQLFRGELDWIVMKALEKDRNRRYPTANSLAADVQRYLHDEPVQACPPSAWYKLRKLARRRRASFAVASTAALSVLLALVGLAVSHLRISNEKGRTEQALGLVRREERQKTEQLWEALVAQARATRLSRRAGQRFESLEILQRATRLAGTLELPAEKFDELRNAAIATLALPDLYLTGPWNVWPADAYAFDFDEAHAVYARTDRQGICSIRRVVDDVEIHRLPGLGGPATPYLRPDGKFVALVHLGRDQKTTTVAVHFWKLDETTPRQILTEQNGYQVSFHRDGGQVAVAYNDGTICLFELPTGRQLSRLATDTLTREVHVALHPTEPVVAVCSYFGSVVQLRDVGTGEVLASLPQGTNPHSVAWHPDGRTLAVGLAEARRIHLYDVGRIVKPVAHEGSEIQPATPRPFRTLETDQTASFLSFNHAGDRLASRGWGSFVELFDVGTGETLFATVSMSGTMRFRVDDRRLAGAIQNGKLGIWQVGDGREYRTLVHPTLAPREREHRQGAAEIEYQSVAVNPDGRLLAAATKEGFGLWDLASGSELAFIPTGGGNNAVLFEPSGALLALGPAGLFRWAIREPLDAAASKTHFNSPSPRGEQWIIGPPEPLPLPRGHALDQSRDGRVIVSCSRAVAAEEPHAGGWILHADRPSAPIRLDAGADIHHIAVSSDGRWVVTVTLSPSLSKIWDARDGRLVKQLAEWGSGYPRFSPDGRWLATNLDGGRLFAVGSWEPGPGVGEWAVFAPDSRLMAVQPTTGVIRLVDPATGHELASLEDPNLDWTFLPVFTPDGSMLIGYSNGKSKGIKVWDLRLIRRHLAEMGLDWNAPPYPPAEVESKTVGFPTMEVRLGDSAKPALAHEQKARHAIEEYRRAVETDPESPKACNNLAWAYVTAPEALRDVAAGLPLAEKAVRLDPHSAVYRNTLGVAYYRAGRFREAVDTLRANLDSQEDWALAFDLYFLAMGYHQLSETARARDYYDWAVRWTAAQPSLSAEHLEELNLFRAEAAELLGIEDKQDESQSNGQDDHGGNERR